MSQSPKDPNAVDDELDNQQFAAWAEARGLAQPPPAAARARLLEAVGGVGRFRPLVGALARLTDLGADALDAVLRKIDEAGSWIEGAPGVAYFHFTPGPGAASPAAGLVRVRPGATFPRHRHLGHEVSLVLDGVLIDDAGTRHTPGACLESAAGTEHAYAAGAGRDLLLVSLHGGIAFSDPTAFRVVPPG